LKAMYMPGCLRIVFGLNGTATTNYTAARFPLIANRLSLYYVETVPARV
jgi:hypothetical protein